MLAADEGTEIELGAVAGMAGENGGLGMALAGVAKGFGETADVDRVVDERVLDEAEAGAHRLGAKAEVGVLAEERERLVEAAEPFQQPTRVGHVRGRKPAVRPSNPERARDPVEEMELGGIGQDRALEDLVVVAPGREQRLEPAGRGTAVVVGEGDEIGPGLAPAEVPARSRPARRDLEDADVVGARVAVQLGVRGIADHDHLEVRSGDRLRGECLERERKPGRPAPSRNHDGDAWRVRHRPDRTIPPMSGSGPEISVVVATRDREARLARLRAAIETQTLAPDRYELIVVEDRSGDGPAVARNAGWRRAGAPLVAFTDDDCEPAADWLERILEAVAANPGRIIQGATRPNPAELHENIPFQRTKRIEAASPFFQTCNIVYPRELLEWLGGFDERFSGPAGEDADLGWRAAEAGIGRVFDPRLVVFHAVEQRSAADFVAEGLRGWESAYAYARHPGLRAEASYGGVFWARSHARLLAAAAGMAMARRQPAGLALALPYAYGVAARVRTEGAIRAAPAIVARDFAEVVKAVRGSIAARIFLL